MIPATSFTLNEYERYYQYKVRISPEVLDAYRNGAPLPDCFITDMRTSSVKLRNGDTTSVNWYQFRIPLVKYVNRVGSINDFTSMRFMRMFMTGFQKPIVLRFGSLDLVRGEWRIYKQNLNTSPTETGQDACELRAAPGHQPCHRPLAAAVGGEQRAGLEYGRDGYAAGRVESRL